jgi:hypothetical protein
MNIITFIIIPSHHIVAIINIHSITSNLSFSTVRTVRTQYFEEACSWAANEKTPLSAVVLVGHWNTNGDGCEGGLSVPSAYQKLLTLNACKPIASKVGSLLLMKMMWMKNIVMMNYVSISLLLLLMMTIMIDRNCSYIHICIT